MAISCWAPDCKHNNMRQKCRFFRFPQKRTELETWTKLLRRNDHPGQWARVCSCHFLDGKKQNGPSMFTHNPGTLFESYHPTPQSKKMAKQEKSDPSTSVQEIQKKLMPAQVCVQPNEPISSVLIKTEPLTSNFIQSTPTELFCIKTEPASVYIKPEPISSNQTKTEPPTLLNFKEPEPSTEKLVLSNASCINFNLPILSCMKTEPPTCSDTEPTLPTFSFIQSEVPTSSCPQHEESLAMLKAENDLLKMEIKEKDKIIASLKEQLKYSGISDKDGLMDKWGF